MYWATVLFTWSCYLHLLLRFVVKNAVIQVLCFKRQQTRRKGCVSHLRVRCESCDWVYTFHTAKKQKYAFDSNRRFVYAMRSYEAKDPSFRYRDFDISLSLSNTQKTAAGLIDSPFRYQFPLTYE